MKASEKFKLKGRVEKLSDAAAAQEELEAARPVEVKSLFDSIFNRDTLARIRGLFR